MKIVLVLLLLLTFVVNVYSKCKPNEVFDEQAQKCVKYCEEGQVYNKEKYFCECPQGKILKKGKCEPINQCNGGKIIFGVCKCPLGKKQQNGKCIPDLKCKQGEKLLNGKCVKQHPINCPHGTIKSPNGQCVRHPPISCPSGLIRTPGGVCIKQHSIKCPSGTIKTPYGQCITPFPRKCSNGYKQSMNGCIRINVPTSRLYKQELEKKLVDSNKWNINK